MKRRPGDIAFQTVNYTALGVLALVTFFPLYYVFIVSLTEPAEFLQKRIVLWPDTWSFQSYAYLLSTEAFPRSVANSAFLASVGTLCSLAVSSSLAYALSQRRMAGRRLLMGLILLTILFSPGVIPAYMLVRQLGLMGSLWALIIPSLASGWNVLLMKGFFDSLPAELSESAAIDGCGEVRTWLRIILPLSLPALAAFGLFHAVGYWNQFFSALLYLNDPKQWPIQVLLQNMLLSASTTDLGTPGEYVQAPPTEMLKMAAVMIATVPILLVYPFLQKHFAKGALVGSVKS
ncbi:binding-protein-dependent transport system inner membrane component [Paenibacillus mucilaginosus 3016]|uniref:Binding-protein-dependent transport system inner membrane component n=2 Tax=Paenibacillus mucilaginosus TaxID=61624 RepID=H6NPX7_9BACL|nr:carbohydrate ABC transporter permease [Paenibacillus mucilaginosus]AFC31168.1 binding-protein-dependent transport system inner membrane component [Paenibacillus mucilaginosus 3016]AFH63489.1 ABC transporter permease [Paenibacillus mucilaginosus K02]WFA19744.1 carbohydrate ABC transporter permease [Paenibacillus mucilaginosus]